MHETTYVVKREAMCAANVSWIGQRPRRLDEEKEFSSILLAAADEGLQAILGDPQAKAVNWHVKRLMVLSNPGAFIRALQAIFGVQGAWIFEDAILRELYEKVDEKYESNNDIPFEEHVRKAQMLFFSLTPHA